MIAEHTNRFSKSETETPVAHATPQIQRSATVSLKRLKPTINPINKGILPFSGNEKNKKIPAGNGYT